MDSRSNDEVYVDWVSKWRQWKIAWSENDEPLVQFHLKFIAKNRDYSPRDHADFVAEVNDTVERCRVDKKGLIELNTRSTVRKTISVQSENQLGVVALKFEFCSRPDILMVALVLENLGHGVFHDNGRVVSSFSVNEENTPRKMPFRDDPVWEAIKEKMKDKRN